MPYGIASTLPAPVSSPPVDPTAPFTPTVVSLIHQLEPDSPPTLAELENAAALLHGTEATQASTPCTGVGSNVAPTGTTPAIAPLCWVDAMGVDPIGGAQVNQATGTPLRNLMAGSFDPALMNAWGQVEGTEGRWLGVTGIYGPQMDIARIPNWGRNDSAFSEDPFLAGTMGAAETNGIQGKGLMSQVKHFAMYDGGPMDQNTQVQDQAAHEIFLQPYEQGANGGGQLSNPGNASSMMCSYERYSIEAAPNTTVPSQYLGPTGGDLSCNNQLKNNVARGQWGWQGFFATDYRLGMDNTVQAINSGTDQEMPDSIWFGDQLAADVYDGVVPLSTFNTAVARVLYQEERFHLLGHTDANSNYLSPSNPSDSTGEWAISQQQKDYDASIVERAAEESAALLQNAGSALPLTSADTSNLLVLGEAAEYMPATNGAERAPGYPDRTEISPLEQLKQFAAPGSHITYLPYVPGSNTVGDGVAVPESVLSTDGTTIGTGLMRTAGPGAPTEDANVDFTSVSGNGQLQLGQTYTWSGYINVPTSDSYTFHLQFSVPGGGANKCGCINDLIATQGSACSSSTLAPTFAIASQPGVGQQVSQQSLSSAGSTQASTSTAVTMSGYTERDLANCYYSPSGALSPGVYHVQLSWTTPASLGTDTYNLREPGSNLPSLRFGYSRSNGDLADVLAAAHSASKVLVFADAPYAGETASVIPQASVDAFDSNTNSFIPTLAQANPNIVAVVNAAVPVLIPWSSNVKAILQMGQPGQEGGTATSRLLLGLADPSGHVATTWPASSDQTIYTYNETTPLYPGDTTGVHNERLGAFGNAPSSTFDFSEGIYVGYRFFDQEGITPAYPFGYGLSYTHFRFANLQATPTTDGGVNVGFDVTNTGGVAGAEASQVYVGPASSVPPGVQQAARSLAGFDRVQLNPGQTAHEVIHIGPGSDINGYGNRRAFEYWSSPAQAWTTAAGCRTLWVGDADSLTSLALTTTTCITPVANVPETPWLPVFVFPLTGLLAGAVAMRRRRTRSI